PPGGRARRRAARSASSRWPRSCRHRGRNEPALLEQRDDALRALLRLLLLGLDPDLRGLRGFIRIGHAGELLDLAPERLLVQALHVAAGAHPAPRADRNPPESAAPPPHPPRPVPPPAGRPGGGGGSPPPRARAHRHPPR